MKENREGKSTLIRMYNVSQHYKIIDKVGRGTYGTVFKAKGLKDNKFYAIKKLENNDTKLQQEGFPITALREISLLKEIDHPNIIKLKEIILSKPSKRNLFRGSTFLVFQYMDHDFAGLFRMKIKYQLSEIKCIISQIIEGVAYLHSHKIYHRDIKSANILMSDEGAVKLADFGLGRKVRFESAFTYKVVTLWYRAPELLFGCRTYSDKIDVWSIGCVLVQFLTGEVLFKKQTQFAQIQRIYEICGDLKENKVSEDVIKTFPYLKDLAPKKPYKNEIANFLRKAYPSITQAGIDLIQKLLHIDPTKRLSCKEALEHQFFTEKPEPCNREKLPKMEYECHEMFRDKSIKIDREKILLEKQRKEEKDKDLAEKTQKAEKALNIIKQAFVASKNENISEIVIQKEKKAEFYEVKRENDFPKQNGHKEMNMEFKFKKRSKSKDSSVSRKKQKDDRKMKKHSRERRSRSRDNRRSKSYSQRRSNSYSERRESRDQRGERSSFNYERRDRFGKASHDDKNMEFRLKMSTKHEDLRKDSHRYRETIKAKDDEYYNRNQRYLTKQGKHLGDDRHYHQKKNGEKSHYKQRYNERRGRDQARSSSSKSSRSSGGEKYRREGGKKHFKNYEKRRERSFS